MFLYGTRGERATPRFLVLGRGRTAPLYDQLKNPAIGNASILTNAEQLMQTIGSSWQAPAGIAVHQIAGIGEDTLSGITYAPDIRCTERYISQNSTPTCLRYESSIRYTPEEVKDGDGTVVTPSALVMSDDSEQVKRWWVDLDENNDDNRRVWIFRLRHGNIFEVDELRTFIFDNLLTNTSATLPEYLSNAQPDISRGDRLRFILHSPLLLSVTTADGEVGPNVATIPDATYKRYGEVQVIWVPKDTAPTLHLTGVMEGSFTLEVEEYTDDALIATTTFSGVPSAQNTLVEMSFPDGTIQNADDLEIDYNGDGTTDLILEPEAGEIVTLPEPSLTDLLSILKETITNLDITDKIQEKLTKQVEKLEKKIEHKKKNNQKTLDKLKKAISQKTMKGKVDTSTADEIIALIDQLETQIEDMSPDTELLTALKEKIQSLDIKQKQKDQLIKRIEKLDKIQKLTNALMQLEAKIIKKGEKGDIDNADVEALIELLDKIEKVI